MAVYRAPMRSRDDGVDPGLAVDRALRLGLCGVGGRLPVAPVDLDDAVAATEVTHGPRAAARLRRFAQVADGSVVWTRDAQGDFWSGVLSGAWRYDGDAKAHAADLVHVRPCSWSAAPDQPPDAVLASFARGGRNFQRVTRAVG